ncbi:MAG: hypothetical protein ACRC2T_05240 [Thermoguttaceae bacterium]
MKRLIQNLFLVLIAVAIISGGSGNLQFFASQAKAQDLPIPMPLTKKQRVLAQAIVGPTITEMFGKYRPGVIGVGFLMNPMLKDGFAQEIGMSADETDMNSIMEMFKEVLEAPENAEQLKTFGELMQSLDSRVGEDDDELVLTDEENEILRNGYKTIFDGMSELATELFTPEQLERVAEMEFAIYGGVDSPFLSVDALSPLDLTDEQKKELDNFQNEIESEKNEVLDDVKNFSTKIIKTGKISMSDVKALETKTNNLKNKISERMSQILTEEQLEKSKQIIDKQTKYFAKMANTFGGIGNTSSWVPGVDSWKPGDGVADDAANKPAKRRFPRKEPAQPETEPGTE